MNALIVFVKNPVKGKVKTRLSATMGEDKALAIYRELLLHTRNLCQLLTDTQVVVYYADFLNQDDLWNSFKKQLQCNGDLGDRMYEAFKTEESADKMVIIGSDCFELKPSHIQEAFDSLSSNDAVIGPANDGGYYLLGLKKAENKVFNEMKWSTSDVFSQTIDRFKELNLSYLVLEELVDIDTEEDLKISRKNE